MSELEKTAYDRGFYNGIREARQIFAKHLNVSTSTDEIKWDNVSKNEILSEIDNFMTKNEAYPQPQLTIPKSVADELDGYFKYKNPFEAILRDYSVRSNDVIEELRDYLDFLHSNLELCIAYLAGKALGVDLVKVI
ncbi:hypothetical protein [Lactococcus lactis]|uniref:hypothetical protein n=1 Tax=Lactococcus lactis TaxID=1358 RepID=UPI0026593BB7|nr:hypothetical protein [Lactococcus lactis]WKG34474.1 hypothetical protein QZH48_09120 [Lactococcus lactis subsp. lactis]WKG35950.1 hypothetical protein QZH48_04825 [Lactococcus lactis subsp. lactis]